MVRLNGSCRAFFPELLSTIRISLSIGREIMLLAVLSGLILSPAAPLLVKMKIGPGWTGWIIALIPLGLLAYFFSFLGLIQSGELSYFSYSWVPSLGVSLSFQLDGLSLLFALLITCIGFLVFVYSGAYLAGHPRTKEPSAFCWDRCCLRAWVFP